MPPVIVAFFIALGLSLGPMTVKGLITPKDPSSRPKWGERQPDSYRTWASRPWIAISNPQTRKCDVTFFALTTRRAPARLVAGDAEQLLDTSWSFERRLVEGERHTIAFNFLNPVGGEQLACQEQSVVCYSQYALSLESTDVREGQCAPAVIPTENKKGGAPKLVGHAPSMTMYNPAIGGAYVDVSFSIVGTVTEAWYCPRIEVWWPDTVATPTTRESDCPPFDQRDPEQRFSWRFNHGFGAGTHDVKACIFKAGAMLACETIKVRILGGANDESTFMGDQR